MTTISLMRLRIVSTVIKRWLFHRAGSSGASLFSKDFFQREDESPDEQFYEVPRFERHIDDEACEALKKFYDRIASRQCCHPGSDVELGLSFARRQEMENGFGTRNE